MSMNLRTQLLEKFKNKQYRDSFVAEHIYSRIPLKIRAMRDRRKMSQKELGALAGVKQEWISKLEDPNYGRLTIATALKIASAFDCGLSVDFVPFSQILEGASTLNRESFDVPTFEEELQNAEAIASIIQERATVPVNAFTMCQTSAGSFAPNITIGNNAPGSPEYRIGLQLGQQVNVAALMDTHGFTCVKTETRPTWINGLFHNLGEDQSRAGISPLAITLRETQETEAA